MKRRAQLNQTINVKQCLHEEHEMRELGNDFVLSRIQCASRKAKGRRWSRKDKALTISLFHSSPKTYGVLQRVFYFPSRATRRLVMTRIAVCLTAIQMNLSHLPDNCKLVSVVVDEMAIKKGLSYDCKLDVIKGFSDNVSRSMELANHAIASMASRIVHKQKQPSYFLSSGPLNGSLTTQLLKKCIDKLHVIGLTVVIVIRDQQSEHVHIPA